MDGIQIYPKGVKKLQTELKPNKASGPDNTQSCFLKECAEDPTPAITLLS